MSARFRNGRTHPAEVTRTNGREGGGGAEIARTIGGLSSASISSDGFDRDRLSARAPEGTRAAARLPAIRARPFLRDKGTTRVIIRFAKTRLRLGAGSSNSRSRESNVRPIRISIQRPKTVEIGASRELRPLLVGSRRGDRAGAAGQAPRGSGRSVVVVTMVRHSKNAGTMGSEGLRYHERRALGFGTVKERLGAETVKNFDACALSLSHATDPVVTPEGVLYDREHILRCLLHQKKDIARKLKAWEEQTARDAEKTDEEAAGSRREALERFHRDNHGGDGLAPGAAGDHPVDPDAEPEDPRDDPVDHAKVIAEAAAEKQRLEKMAAFWLPSKTPTADARAERPDTDTKCPATQKKLRMKDLMDVKWTEVPKDGEKGAEEERYMCPVTRKTFTNASQVMILKPSGVAVSEEAWKIVVSKEGAWDGKRVKGAIRLQKGGSGFAGSGTQVESKRDTLLGVGSGLADSRGQRRGGASKFGLRFN